MHNRTQHKQSSEDSKRYLDVYALYKGDPTDPVECNVRRWFKMAALFDKPLPALHQLGESFFYELSEKLFEAFVENAEVDFNENLTAEFFLRDGRLIDSWYEPVKKTNNPLVKEIAFKGERDFDQMPVRVKFVSTLGDDEAYSINLIKAHASEICPIGKFGASMLNEAAFFAHAEICRALIDHGSDVHALDGHGMAPAHKVGSSPKEFGPITDTLTTLLRSGAGIDQKDANGMRPIHHAAYIGHKNAIAVLIEHGAPLDQLDGNGEAAIHHAALHDRKLNALQMLVKAGADIEQKNGSGLTAVEQHFDLEKLGDHVADRQCALWLITQGARVPSDAVFHDTQIFASEITPKLAAVLGGFLPELADLLDQERNGKRSPSSTQELGTLRGHAQRLAFSEAVAMIDSHCARSIIDQVAARSKRSSSDPA